MERALQDLSERQRRAVLMRYRAADFAPLLSLDPQPEFLLLGTGPTLRRPPPALEAALPFGIEVMDSRAAARAWGVLRAELRWIAAALYPLD